MYKTWGYTSCFFLYIYDMNFILQTIDGKVTLDMCFAMERAKEYWDWKNPNDTIHIMYCGLNDITYFGEQYKRRVGEDFFFQDWCPVGTVEFVETYIRHYFSHRIEDIEENLKPLNVPECFLNNKMNTGRYVKNITIKELPNNLYELSDPLIDTINTEWYVKDNDKVKNPNNGIMNIAKAISLGMRNIQISSLIPHGHNSSEWRCFIHNGKIIDVKNYDGFHFVFPDIDSVINSYEYQLQGTLKEGTLDVYIDELDNETYVMECHKFYSCGLYGFDHPDILPLMYWRTYTTLIHKQV